MSLSKRQRLISGLNRTPRNENKDLENFLDSLRINVTEAVEKIMKDTKVALSVKDNKISSLEDTVTGMKSEKDSLNEELKAFEKRNELLKSLLIQERRNVRILQKEIEILRQNDVQSDEQLEREIEDMMSGPKDLVDDNAADEEGGGGEDSQDNLNQNDETEGNTDKDQDDMEFSDDEENQEDTEADNDNDNNDDTLDASNEDNEQDNNDKEANTETVNEASAEESSCQMRVKTEPTEDNESQNDTFYEKSISDNIEELLKEPSLDSLLANVEHVLNL